MLTPIRHGLDRKNGDGKSNDKLQQTSRWIVDRKDTDTMLAVITSPEGALLR